MCIFNHPSYPALPHLTSRSSHVLGLHNISSKTSASGMHHTENRAHTIRHTNSKINNAYRLISRPAIVTLSGSRRWAQSLSTKTPAGCTGPATQALTSAVFFRAPPAVLHRGTKPLRLGGSACPTTETALGLHPSHQQATGQIRRAAASAAWTKTAWTKTA